MSASPPLAVVGYRVVDERHIGEGGFLQIRRLRLRLEREDGTLSSEGVYDFVERPMGVDAVVLALFRRQPSGAVEVLLREGLRVPIDFGRPEAARRPQPITEVVAGILEANDRGVNAEVDRAAAEAREETGYSIAAGDIIRLGAPMFPSPGMTAELFHLLACEVPWGAAPMAILGDGSPFEEGARVYWLGLDEAIARAVRGEIRDLKTELILRRLRDHLA
jgi:hypothetical protein